MPFLNNPEALKLDPPLRNNQTRVGFLILMFQALVVIPGLTTIHNFPKNRSVPERQGFE